MVPEDVASLFRMQSWTIYERYNPEELEEMHKQREIDRMNGFYDGADDDTAGVPITTIADGVLGEEGGEEEGGAVAAGEGKAEAGFACPWEGCDQVCQTKRGLQSHLGGHRRRAKNALVYSDKVTTRCLALSPSHPLTLSPSRPLADAPTRRCADAPARQRANAARSKQMHRSVPNSPHDWNRRLLSHAHLRTPPPCRVRSCARSPGS